MTLRALRRSGILAVEEAISETRSPEARRAPAAAERRR